MTRAVVKMYVIQEGFALKKVKNDKVTFMVKSFRGGHSMCPRVAENRKATSRWVSSVLKSFIQSNPKGRAKLFKNELQDRYAIKVDSQAVYRAKRIVLEALKFDHAKTYAKIRKCVKSVLREATSRSVSSVLKSFIQSNPKGKAKLFKNELQDRYAVKVDSQTVYRAKRIVLEALKFDHAKAYAKIRKHIIANFISTFKNHNINGKLWHAARVANCGYFNEAMASIRSENANAAD
ncbi:hypothetical protein LWI28_005287 [Acer negundo]|uniref:Uncharacterized protein n=1 Tax=Acer negundo TaxID=4023 RepID=A0AAD5JF89_ACENE|nr:hypothetical protein LWI28_005287 [Acer negundo]